MGACIEVHRPLGRGIGVNLGSLCAAFGSNDNDLLAVVYKGVRLDCGCRVDIVLQDLVEAWVH